MPTTESHREELVKSIVNRYERSKRKSFIVAGVFAVLAVLGWEVAASFTTFNHTPAISALLRIFVVIFAIVSLFSLFDAGRFLEIKYYAPRMLEMERKYQELRKGFEEYMIKSQDEILRVQKTHVDSLLFIKARVPGLLTEYREWIERQALLPADEKEE